jgi:hypothetical protein
MTSGPQNVPGVGAHNITTLLLPIPADARGRLAFHVQARPEGSGDAPPPTIAPTEVQIVDEAAAPGAPETVALSARPTATPVADRLPWVIAVQAAGVGLAREAATPTTIHVTYPSDAGAAIVEVTLEAGGATIPSANSTSPRASRAAAAVRRGSARRAPPRAAHLVVKSATRRGATASPRCRRRSGSEVWEHGPRRAAPGRRAN